MFCFRLRPRAVWLAPCLCLGLLCPAVLLAQPVCTTPTPPPIDNRDGYLVLLEEAPVHPMEPFLQRNELWVANIPDGSVSVFDVSTPASPTLLTEIEVGLGPVTIRKRPPSDVVAEPQNEPANLRGLELAQTGQTAEEPDPVPDVREVWVVCQSSNSVYIVNPRNRRVVDTIRVPHEPAGLVFDEAGEFAYVTLSASNQVAQIDAQTRQVTLFENESPLPTTSADLIHVEEPRALVLHNGELLTLSNLSGNGTTNLGQFGPGNNSIVDLWPFWPNLLEPPDRDVLSFLVPNPPGPGTAVTWRVGSLNQDLKILGDGQLLVSNMDMITDQFVGEPIYRENRFVQHRLSLVTPTAGSPNPPPTVIDLNLDVDSTLLDQGFTCAMPNEMALSGNQRFVYVACYETANTAVVDRQAGANGQVVMELSANGAPVVAPHFGPRGVVLHREANVLYVYNRGDNTLQAFDATVVAGTSQGPLSTTSLGFDLSPRPVIAGRRHLTNSKNSTFGTASCNTCHPDGHLDGLAWELGDFTGDLPNNPAPRDDKRLKVTQSLRGIEETPPFHWRGDRTDLAAFNPAFAGLLGGSELDDDEVEELEEFVFRLSYPPNPKQAEDRQYSNDAQIGFTCFSTVNTVTSAIDSTGTLITAPCTRCHAMTGVGASGTANQIVNDNANLAAGDATQLRGMFDKESDTPLVAGVPIPSTGWGFFNPGTFDTISDFVNIFFGGQDASRVTELMETFDSGLAPTTHYAWTLNASTSGSGAPDPVLLMNAATQGHSDLIVRGWIRNGASIQPVGMLFQPGAPQPFLTDTPGLGPFTFNQLDVMAGASPPQGVFTFVGTPVQSGYRLGLDREMDFLPDGQERQLGTSLSSVDSDNDGFLDGYEVRLGSNPTDATSTPPPETIPPAVQSLTLSWNNSNVAKLRWSTDEESVSRIRVIDTASGSVVHVGEDRTFKKSHVMVARSMQPNRTYRIDVETEDPAIPPNTNAGSVPSVTLVQQPHLFLSSHVQQATLTLVPPIGIGAPVKYRADFTLVDETGAPVANPVVTFDVVEWIPGAGNQPTQNLTTNASSGPGNASRIFTTTNVQGSGGFVEVIARSVSDSSNRLYFHPLDGQFGFWAQVPLP